jgi:hypothetical protein
MSGVLALTRAVELHAEYKRRLEELGFQDIPSSRMKCKKSDALNTIICNKNPRLVMIDSWFYQDATSCRIGELVRLFPKLNIAVVSVHDFSVSRAPSFIWEGAKPYISLWEGYEEFHRGLQIVREGDSIFLQRFKN